VRIVRKFAELQDGRQEAGPRKPSAGVRTIVIPATLVRVTYEHLADHPAGGDELIFRGPSVLGCGAQFSQVGALVGVAAHAGLPVHFHFPDLRRTENNLAAVSGANTREFMHEDR
jgi:hypothetical protein